MGASILIVGNEIFLVALLELLRGSTSLTVETAADPVEALDLIQAQQPDLLLIQLEQPGSLELCQQIRDQQRLAWIYCMVLDDRLASYDLDRQLAIRTQVLEAGADACLFLTLAALASSPDNLPEGSSSDMARSAVLAQQQGLLLAQIQTGLRSVQIHRELMRENDLLSVIALSDPLTELNNRRAFEWQLPRQIQTARSREHPLSLIMLDVDFFKQINDTYGHLVGDRVLMLLAARLRHNLRFYDTPFRYGGEEFVIILDKTDKYEAIAIADRIRQMMRSQPFQVDETLALTVTISAGSATLKPSDDPNGTSLLDRADQRLLQAKAAGRDRVIGCPGVQVRG